MFGATEIYFGTKVKIDKRLRDEILKEFSGETIRYHYEVMNEVWLTAEELSKQIQFFSKSWLKDIKNGKCNLLNFNASSWESASCIIFIDCTSISKSIVGLLSEACFCPNCCRK